MKKLYVLGVLHLLIVPLFAQIIDPLDNLKKKTSIVQENWADEWKFTREEIFEYEDGYLTHTYIKEWNPIDEVIIEGGDYYYIYDENGLIQFQESAPTPDGHLRFVYQFSDCHTLDTMRWQWKIDNQWVNDFIFIISYDEYGRIIKVNTENYNFDTKEWQQTAQTDYQYNVQGKLAYKVQFDTLQQITTDSLTLEKDTVIQLQPDFRYVYEYNELEQLVSKTKEGSFDIYDNQWYVLLNDNKWEYFYDDQGNLINELKYTFDMIDQETKVWKKSQQILYTNNDDGSIKHKIEQYWNNDLGWINNSKYTYYYLDEDINPTQFKICLGNMGYDGQATTSGDGNYIVGELVTLKATIIEGYEFEGWEGNPEDIALLSDPSAIETTFTMPSRNIKIYAKYKLKEEVSQEKYILNLTTQPINLVDQANLQGNGEYVSGSQVQITAKPIEGHVFVKWVGTEEDMALLDSPINIQTSFIMPNRNLEFVATYKTDLVNGLDMSEIPFSMFPNPCLNHVTIKVDNPVQSNIKIIDINGSVIHNQELIDNQTKVSLGGLIPNIYFVKLTNKTGSRTVKLVKY